MHRPATLTRSVRQSAYLSVLFLAIAACSPFPAWDVEAADAATADPTGAIDAGPNDAAFADAGPQCAPRDTVLPPLHATCERPADDASVSRIARLEVAGVGLTRGEILRSFATEKYVYFVTGSKVFRVVRPLGTQEIPACGVEQVATGLSIQPTDARVAALPTALCLLSGAVYCFGDNGSKTQVAAPMGQAFRGITRIGAVVGAVVADALGGSSAASYYFDADATTAGSPVAPPAMTGNWFAFGNGVITEIGYDGNTRKRRWSATAGTWSPLRQAMSPQLAAKTSLWDFVFTDLAVPLGLSNGTTFYSAMPDQVDDTAPPVTSRTVQTAAAISLNGAAKTAVLETINGATKLTLNETSSIPVSPAVFALSYSGAGELVGLSKPEGCARNDVVDLFVRP